MGGADTGIVGVVTGFASLCVDGLEVALPATTPVRIDGAPGRIADLRAGQLALVGSVGQGDALTAQAVSVRHEVTGPVSRVLADGQKLLVAGQTVTVTDATWRAVPARPGDWIAVSGLRTPAGDIAASRIDRAPPGRVRVHGHLLT
ncbi:DUF5666 domain-containing protein, partial [Acidisphaera rubrifaciens]|uniref:DUF5666 domain-containing protein n=1 Tax=Acidisphaera rubrifaciens TaxID=50715 RepID=UPI001F529421